jgi:hypothetical protein
MTSPGAIDHPPCPAADPAERERRGTTAGGSQSDLWKFVPILPAVHSLRRTNSDLKIGDEPTYATLIEPSGLTSLDDIVAAQVQATHQGRQGVLPLSRDDWLTGA